MTSSSTYLKGVVSAIITFTIFGGLLLFFKDDVGGKTFYLLACVTTAFYAYYSREETTRKEIYRGILFGLTTLFLVILVISTVKAVLSKTEWDFLCFYMQGLLGVQHLNFYDPNSFQAVVANIQFNHSFSDSFKSEILDVGLLSPPVTMLFFAPLASLDYSTSKLIFSILIFLFIIIDSFLANRIFFKKGRSIYSLQFTFIILMLLPGTIDTVFYEQTNFFLLFFLLLIIKNINKPASGIYLALSIIIKPITGFLILFFIVNKKWKQAISFAATSAALVGLTALIWGYNNVLGFFTSPPTKRLPHYLYEQPLNQSLIALFNRNLKVLGLSQRVIDLLYYLGAIVLIVFTVAISKKLGKRGTLASFFPYILCMLMIYPSSLNHYMVCIFPVVIYMLSLKEEKLFYWMALAMAFSFFASEVFFSYLVLLIVLSWLGWSHTDDRPPGKRSVFSFDFKETAELVS